MFVASCVAMSIVEIHRGVLGVRGEGDAGAVESQVGSGGNI